MNITNTTDVVTMRKNLINLMGIKAVRLDQRHQIRKYTMSIFSFSVTNSICIFSNICRKNNGGCSHLCLRNPETSYQCACPSGVRLQSNNKTCSNLPEEYLLFTSRNTIRRVSLTADKRMYVELPIPDLENVIAIDYHYQKQVIFQIKIAQLHVFNLIV